MFPELKAFVMEHTGRYSNLEVNFIPHHNPDLVLLDAAGRELQRVDLTKLASSASIHRLMRLFGMQEVCRDENTACAAWAAQGECDANPDFMHADCRRSCGVCAEGAVEGEVPCRDTGSKHDCEYWTTMGECEQNEAFMKGQCAKSCGFCVEMQSGSLSGNGDYDPGDGGDEDDNDADYKDEM